MLKSSLTWPYVVEISEHAWCSKFKFMGTVNSRFGKVHFSFLQSRVVRFKKDLCSESKNQLSEKMPYIGEFATWNLS